MTAGDLHHGTMLKLVAPDPDLMPSAERAALALGGLDEDEIRAIWMARDVCRQVRAHGLVPALRSISVAADLAEDAPEPKPAGGTADPVIVIAGDASVAKALADAECLHCVIADELNRRGQQRGWVAQTAMNVLLEVLADVIVSGPAESEAELIAMSIETLQVHLRERRGGCVKH